MDVMPATPQATAEQRRTIDTLSASLGLPSEAPSVATGAEARAVIAELELLRRRRCWRG